MYTNIALLFSQRYAMRIVFYCSKYVCIYLDMIECMAGMHVGGCACVNRLYICVLIFKYYYYNKILKWQKKGLMEKVDLILD